jgi:trigger factor
LYLLKYVVMQISLTHTSDTEVNLSVVANEAEMRPLKDHVLEHFQSRVKLPGFREGKAPLSMVEKSVDQAQLQSEFLEEAINQMYVQAINQEKLRPVANPEVSLKKFVPFTALEFEAKVEVVGKIELADYKKMKKEKPEVKILAKDVNEVIGALQKRVAEKQDVDRAAKADDQVWIDFKGVDDKGEPVKGADGKDYPLVLGSNTFIPGFEDNVVGMKANDEKTFTLKFPKDYGVTALAGKDVTFTVTVTKVQEVVEPKVDDEFAAKVGPFKTVDELKEDIKKQLKIERQQEADRKFENELIQDITAKSKVAVPKVLVDEQVDRIEQEERQNLVYRGQTWQEHLDEEGVTAEEHREQKRPAAEERVKAGLVLSEISEVEKIDITPEELEIRIQLLKGQYQDATMQVELDKPENRREILSRMLTEKTMDKLKSYVLTTK